MENGENDPLDVRQNIACGNGQYGLSWPTEGVGSIGCNDWFKNGAGEIEGRVPGGDLSLDPMFCNPDSGDFRLGSTSPLADAAGCGRIGALDAGCGVTPTLVQKFTASRTANGVRVVWEVSEGATASEIWLERSEAAVGQGWLRPVMERSFENGAVIELDRSADPDREYWYRLAALDGNSITVVGPPIVVEAQARLDYRLLEVGPSPGSGPLRISFALKSAAAIEVGVFDMLGRRVSSPVRGVWPPGTHEVVWDGRAGNGEPAPAGVYVVRYAFPGGQDRRPLVRLP